MIPYKHLSLENIFQDCQEKFQNDKYQFLEQIIDLEEIVPASFLIHFHASTGRPRKHLLFPMLWSLILQRIFSIPTDSLLITFLKYSKELRDFCGFDVVPDASKFARFKQDFLPDLQSTFDHLKDSFCVAGRKTQNKKTLHADLLLGGITQLITVLVADKINQHQYIRSLKPLIA